MVGLLSDRYAGVMTHNLPMPILDYMTNDVHAISEVQWRMTRKYDMYLYAKVDGESKRYMSSLGVRLWR